jgi:hypothetical protein
MMCIGQVKWIIFCHILDLNSIDFDALLGILVSLIRIFLSVGTEDHANQDEEVESIILSFISYLWQKISIKKISWLQIHTRGV